MRHFSKHSVKKSIRFTARTNALILEYRAILSQKYPDMFNDENAVTFGQVVDRAVSAFLAEAVNSEESLKTELAYYKAHGYMSGSPKALKEEAKA